MIDLLASFDLTAFQWGIVVVCALLIGMTKTGLSGAAMLVVPVLAGIFGGKPSVGLLLPLLCFGDVFGVSYYSRHTEWRYIRQLMPWALIGIGIALFVGNMVSDTQFREILAYAIMLSIGILIWKELRHGDLKVPDYWWFSALMGLGGGFATMIGNAAGPIMILYLLSKRLPKYRFIGTQAWFFLIVNFLKVPLHIFFWHTITLKTLAFDAVLLPAIAVGALLGVRVVRVIPEKPYRIIIMTVTVLAALKLFV